MSSSIGQVLNQLSISKAVVFSAILGGLYYSYYYDDGSKLESQIKEVENNIAEEEKKKIETDKVKAAERDITNQVAMLAEKFKEVTARFPVNLKSDELISNLNTLASLSNVRVVSVSKEPIQSKDLYEEVPVKIELSGTFNNLVLLMFNISNQEKITNLGEFDLSNISSEYNGTLKLTTRIIGYKYKKPPEKESSPSTGEGVTPNVQGGKP